MPLSPRQDIERIGVSDHAVERFKERCGDMGLDDDSIRAHIQSLARIAVAMLGKITTDETKIKVQGVHLVLQRNKRGFDNLSVVTVLGDSMLKENRVWNGKVREFGRRGGDRRSRAARKQRHDQESEDHSPDQHFG